MVTRENIDTELHFSNTSSPRKDNNSDKNNSKAVEEIEVEKYKKIEEDNCLESVLRELNGCYHVKLVILVGLLALVSASHCTNYIFVAEDAEFRCKYPNCYTAELDELHSNSSLDLKCLKYNLENTSACTEENFDFNYSEPCHEWVYDDDDSFVAQFNLGCENWKRTLVGSSHSFGYILGLLLVGPLSDKFGRKPLIILTAVSGAFIGLWKSFVTSYWLYIALEILGAMIGDPYSATFTLSIETVSKEFRPIIPVCLGLFSTSGGIIQALVAWISPNWRIFVIAIYAPAFLFISYIFFLDESVRWLLNKGDNEKAIIILKKISKCNKNIDADKLNNLKPEHDVSENWKDMVKITFKSRKLFLRLLGCICVWFTTLFNAYTLTINAVSLEGNKYLNYGLMRMGDIPGCCILYYLLTKCKRKLPMMFTLMLTGGFCVAQSFVSKDHPIISLMLYILGHMNSVLSIRIVYLYTSEIFPTYTRNTMHALCSALGRISILLSPQTPLLLQYWSGFPSFIVGVLSLLTATVVTLMPDTADDVLPDNVAQAEGVGGKKEKLHVAVVNHEHNF